MNLLLLLRGANSSPSLTISPVRTSMYGVEVVIETPAGSSGSTTRAVATLMVLNAQSTTPPVRAGDVHCASRHVLSRAKRRVNPAPSLSLRLYVVEANSGSSIQVCTQVSIISIPGPCNFDARHVFSLQTHRWVGAVRRGKVVQTYSPHFGTLFQPLLETNMLGI